jgi:hypothetical protein
VPLPGGRLALAVWGAPERNPWAAIGGMLLVRRAHMAPPEPGAPGVFSVASEEHTSGRARSAMVIRGLADQRREAIKEQLAEAFAPCTVDGGYELPGVCLNAMAN